MMPCNPLPGMKFPRHCGLLQDHLYSAETSTERLLGQTGLAEFPVTAMGVELQNGHLWLSGSAGIMSQYDANGILLGNTSVSLGTIVKIIADNQGGLWIADQASLINLDSAGMVNLGLSLPTSTEDINDLTIFGDGSLWISVVDQIWRYTPSDGLPDGLVQRWSASPTDPRVNTLSQQTDHNSPPDILSDPVVEL